MINFIQKGKLSKQEVELLERDMRIYQSLSVKGEVTKEGGTYDSAFRECDIHFIDPFRFPNTAQILQSTVIESYHNIYPYFDYGRMSSFQYVKYDDGGFFKLHNDTIKNPPDYQRVLTLSINLSAEENYEGGLLVVHDPVTKTKMYCSKEKGSFMIFPAFLAHEAAVVTSGTREAVVTWLLTDIDHSTVFKQYYEDQKLQINSQINRSKQR
jgi:predicted 2-oxoglutarate/Fe(II)-dependent dioxygenase YbiX